MIRRFRPEELDAARKIKLLTVVEEFSDFYTQDKTFKPQRNMDGKVFVVEIDGKRFSNLLITGEKWFDQDKKVGGGGAIDLLMHLKSITFVQAVKLLGTLIEERSNNKE